MLFVALRRLLPLWMAAVVCSGGAASASHTGVCPDGSIYVVQETSQIPCADAKPVDVGEVPPIRPHYLPQPYTWKVWNERHSPENPYNVIDAARQVRDLDAPPPAPGGAPARDAAHAAPVAPVAPALPSGPVALGLAETDLRDLFQIVELSQDRAPARLARESAGGQGVFEVAFAHSTSFEALLREAWAKQGGLPTGGVLLFTARSVQPEEFYANFTFLQEHLTFQPDATDPRQLGVLQGRLGALAAGEEALGYVALPPNFDVTRQLDVYWDDRHITVSFAR